MLVGSLVSVDKVVSVAGGGDGRWGGAGRVVPVPVVVLVVAVSKQQIKRGGN